MQMATVNPSALEELPAYQAHESNADAAPTMMGDAVMNDALQASIEEDEGIGMDATMDNGYDVQNYATNYNPLGVSNWNFQALGMDNLGRNTRGQMVSGTGSDIDAASDIVQDNSSASAGSRQGRLDDFDNAIPEGDDGVFIDPSPVPDLDEDGQASVIALQHDLLESRNHGVMYPPFEVPAGDELEVEEPATEIHIEEGEELKMD
jgi:ubiquitin carboxyl-terminal hydrolase 4/11